MAKRTGYTHQWITAAAQPLRSLVMASVDSPVQRDIAKLLGWRTFRTKHASAPVLPGEIVCPASEEAGKRTTCARCGLCDGSRTVLNPDRSRAREDNRKDIVINVHGAAKGRYQ